jgi:hypothetical protein
LFRAGFGSAVGSKMCVGKNSRFIDRYSEARSWSAWRLSSMSGRSIARWVAVAVMSVWPKPTIAETRVPVATAVSRFLPVPGDMPLVAIIATPETTNKIRRRRPVLVQKSSCIGFLRRPLASAVKSFTSLAGARMDECSMYWIERRELLYRCVSS